MSLSGVVYTKILNYNSFFQRFLYFHLTLTVLECNSAVNPSDWNDSGIGLCVLW